MYNRNRPKHIDTHVFGDRRWKRAVRRARTRNLIRRRLNEDRVHWAVFTSWKHTGHSWHQRRVHRTLAECAREDRHFLKNELKNEFFSERKFCLRDWDVPEQKERARKRELKQDTHELSEWFADSELPVFWNGKLATKRKRGKHLKKCRIRPPIYTW